jgi:ABC-type transport system involved in multi-copper enzyme maturation permease subunit
MAVTPVIADRHITTAQRHALPTVIAWEARRLRASRTTWVIVLLAFGLFLLVVWLLWLLKFAGSGGFGNGTTFITYSIPVTSAQGLVITLPVFSFLLALILPFVNTDGTARDLKQRTHELLMSTSVPSWAYIWGRYLVCLFVSLGLAALLLTALLLMGLILHQTQADYPPPQPGALILIWAVALVPTAILISSASFALGTILQRHSNLVKIGLILSWFMLGLVLPSIPVGGSGHVPAWYLTWEPTNIGMTALLQAPYNQGATMILTAAANGGSASAILAALADMEQQVPDLGPYILPHLIWVGFGLALVGYAALSFKRFSNS